MMMLLTKTLMAKMIMQGTNPDRDNSPVVKLFNPCGSQTWLFSELGMDGDTLFGLCDLGMGCPELGSVSLQELKEIRTAFGLGIERDRNFKTDMPMSYFVDIARLEGRIVA